MGDEMAGHALARQRQRGPVLARLREEVIAEIRHPELAAAPILVEQPDAARVALALLDERLDEDAEEAGDVRLAHQQVERELHGVALDPRGALGQASRIGLARQLA